MTTTEHRKPVESVERWNAAQELLGRYWDLAFREGRDGINLADEANQVLYEFRTLLAADDNALTTNSVVDQKGTNVDDKADGEALEAAAKVADDTEYCGACESDVAKAIRNLIGNIK